MQQAGDVFDGALWPTVTGNVTSWTLTVTGRSKDWGSSMTTSPHRLRGRYRGQHGVEPAGGKGLAPSQVRRVGVVHVLLSREKASADAQTRGMATTRTAGRGTLRLNSQPSPGIGHGHVRRRKRGDQRRHGDVQGRMLTAFVGDREATDRGGLAFNPPPGAGPGSPSPRP